MYVYEREKPEQQNINNSKKKIVEKFENANL